MSNLRKVALIAGIGYLIIFVTGFYANFSILESYVDRDDPDVTFTNIQSGLIGFNLGIFAFIIMVLADLLLTWALYVLFETPHKKLSLLAAYFRLVNVTLFAVALPYLLKAKHLVFTSAGKDGIDLSTVYSALDLAFTMFNNTWLLALVFFGIHLILLGRLMYSLNPIPIFIPILLLVAGCGYLLDSFAQFFMSDYQQYASLFLFIVVIPGVLGELSLTFWLLLKGGKEPFKFRNSI